MGRKGMPKQMRMDGLGERGSCAGLAAGMGNAHTGDWFTDAVSRKEPGLELVELPIAPQQREQVGGEHHQAIALAFALTHPNDHASRVDVGALELTEFGDPHARGIEGGENSTMLQVAWGQQQRLDLLATEDDRKRL